MTAFPYETSWKGNLYRHFRCSSCSSTFIGPVPTQEALDDVYRWSEYHDFNLKSPGMDRRYEKSLAFLADHVHTTGRLLDFGCGRGEFLVRARSNGYSTIGVELSDEVARYAERNCGLAVTTLEEVERGGDRFDVIVLRDVLTHLTDPVRIMVRLIDLLSPGGSILIDGPLEEEASVVRLVSHSIKGVRRSLGRDFVDDTPPTMLFRVSARSLRSFLTDRIKLVEIAFEISETGWPYHVPGRFPRDTRTAVKEVIGCVAIGTAQVARLVGLTMGNRCLALYRRR